MSQKGLNISVKTPPAYRGDGTQPLQSASWNSRQSKQLNADLLGLRYRWFGQRLEVRTLSQMEVIPRKTTLSTANISSPTVVYVDHEVGIPHPDFFKKFAVGATVNVRKPERFKIKP